MLDDNGPAATAIITRTTSAVSSVPPPRGVRPDNSSTAKGDDDEIPAQAEERDEIPVQAEERDEIPAQAEERDDIDWLFGSEASRRRRPLPLEMFRQRSNIGIQTSPLCSSADDDEEAADRDDEATDRERLAVAVKRRKQRNSQRCCPNCGFVGPDRDFIIPLGDADGSGSTSVVGKVAESSADRLKTRTPESPLFIAQLSCVLSSPKSLPSVQPDTTTAFPLHYTTTPTRTTTPNPKANEHLHTLRTDSQFSTARLSSPSQTSIGIQTEYFFSDSTGGLGSHLELSPFVTTATRPTTLLPNSIPPLPNSIPLPSNSTPPLPNSIPPLPNSTPPLPNSIPLPSNKSQGVRKSLSSPLVPPISLRALLSPNGPGKRRSERMGMEREIPEKVVEGPDAKK
ncbi:hypothetical protein BV898_15305 [Hypsibius exemplaris]|uniref:Uncharacterized protein n=1 Tax=Hypsibius exemplaris TaxID=2072580 RepID=A0A9X6NDT4_HYPEX|nr:hypothetical protein BV898_15305 [Hypsibius exemplaris]